MVDCFPTTIACVLQAKPIARRESLQASAKHLPLAQLRAPLVHSNFVGLKPALKEKLMQEIMEIFGHFMGIPGSSWVIVTIIMITMVIVNACTGYSSGPGDREHPSSW